MNTTFTVVTTLDSISVDFNRPAEPLSINAVGRSWEKRYRLGKPWREMAWALFRTRRLPWAEPAPVFIQATLPFRHPTRRDPHNYVGTTMKAIVDGLVAAGVIPDDTAQWATIIEPTLVIQAGTRPMIATITITKRNDHGQA